MATQFRFRVKSVNTGPYGRSTSRGEICLVTESELVIPGANYESTPLEDIEKFELEDGQADYFAGVNVRGYFFCLVFGTQKERDAVVRALVQITGAPAWRGWQRVY